MSDNSTSETGTLLGGLLETLRAAANAEDGTARRRESKETALGRVSVEHAVRIGPGLNASGKRIEEHRPDSSRPVRVDVDGTSRVVTVDLSETTATREGLSTAISGDTLRISTDDGALLKITLGDGSWKVSETTLNNGVYQVRVVQ